MADAHTDAAMSICLMTEPWNRTACVSDAKQERFDVCGIPSLSRDSIRYALNRRFGVPQPAELRYLSR